jgi:pilus assembly protein Flp/PilA
VSEVLKLLNEVRKDEEGAAMAEYVVLLGIITVALVGVMGLFATQIKNKFDAVCATLTGTSGGTC